MSDSGKNVLRSMAFNQFWTNMVDNCSIASLSQWKVSNSIGAVAPSSDIIGWMMNPSVTDFNYLSFFEKKLVF